MLERVEFNWLPRLANGRFAICKDQPQPRGGSFSSSIIKKVCINTKIKTVAKADLLFNHSLLVQNIFS
jgi:hypothetical protein